MKTCRYKVFQKRRKNQHHKNINTYLIKIDDTVDIVIRTKNHSVM